MSQDQATESKTTNQDPAHTVKKNHSIHDPMATEEIRTSFQEDSSRVIENQAPQKDTSSFRIGIAQAFAQEEDIACTGSRYSSCMMKALFLHKVKAVCC